MAERDWGSMALLAEPTRRRVYDAVRAAGRPMTRDAVAEAAGISRALAAFHCDQLAEGGLLTVDYARPEGRRGPGAGRPAKRYQVAAPEVAVSLPPRQYALAARLLATSIRDADAGVVADLLGAAEEEGRRMGSSYAGAAGESPDATVQRLAGALDALGYDSEVEDGPRLRLRNCPFHAVVEVAPDLVCTMNHHLVSGLLAGAGGHPDVVAELSPAPPGCCVTLGVRRCPP